ncbi:MAG: hypothetical protein R3E79_20035 [Caldilineaceae bacterium]
MIQAKFTIDNSQTIFLNNFRQYGFRDKSALVRAALHRFQQELERQQLIESANLYAEIYGEDEELQELTETALEGWPE